MSDEEQVPHRDAVISDQYETFPYPPRDPADETKRLVTGSPSHLLELNHYLFAGRRDFSQPFRALVAGGGTGDAAIMLGQHLADTGGPHEIVYLDMSRASTEIARARAAARGLAKIRFLSGSILDIDRLAPGPYDYIDCCGVLHHLEDPPAALAALRGALHSDGGMGLMVYAPLGRTGVYPVQVMLSALDRGEAPPQRVATARALLDALPPTNWLKRNPYVADHLQAGDPGLYDLILHRRDRAYSVSEVGALCDAAGMKPVAFIEPIRYDPLALIGDPDLVARLESMSWLDRCAFAELMSGNLKTHVFYANRQAGPKAPTATLSDDGLVPRLVGMNGEKAAESLRRSGRIQTRFDGLTIAIPVNEAECDALALFDDRRTVGEIQREADRDAFRRIFAILNATNSAFLCMPADWRLSG